MMDCKCQVGFKVSIFVSHPLALFCPFLSENATNKRWKRTKARKGEPVEREPPTGSPKWALSDEWREIMQRREQEQTEM